jgi:hypothetical protein
VFFIVHSLATVNTIPLHCLLSDHYLCMHLASIEHFHHQKHKTLNQHFHYDALFVFDNRGLKFCFRVSEERATYIFRTNESRSEFRFSQPEGGISTLLRNVGKKPVITRCKKPRKNEHRLLNNCRKTLKTYTMAAWIYHCAMDKEGSVCGILITNTG